jgi:hypothetical protein
MRTKLLLIFASSALFQSQLLADEGMWLFTDPPTTQLESKYHFTPTTAWLDHLQKSSVRIGDEGTGSFVSPDGLVLTNQHIGVDWLQKLSDAQHDYVADGFYAATLAEEKRCPDLELNVLMSVEDVTDRVNAPISPGLNAAQAFLARQKAIAEIEKESDNRTGLHSEVVTLYGGGSYQLYRYKRYTDVRLVFAPEEQMAFYGGDPDNFEFPRFDLDICFFRAYENDKPAAVENYLKFDPRGPAANDLVFVSGHPGHTDRQLTVSALTNWRDLNLPLIAEMLYRSEVLLSAFSARALENERRVKADLLSTQNTRKSIDGELAALLDPVFFEKRVQTEKALRSRLDSLLRPASDEGAARQPAPNAFDRIGRAEDEFARVVKQYLFFEGTPAHGPAGFDSELFQIARTLIRAAEERPKPNGDRLTEFQDSNQVTLELGLFSDAPIYDDVEELKLASSLTDLACRFGASNPLIQQVLAGKSPRDRAAELVTGTKLKDVALRRQLYGGGASALEASADPMLKLARLVDPTARAARKGFDEAGEVERQAYAEIARARFTSEGRANYPDATFTLRLSYGRVIGYEENGRFIPPFTTVAGLYQAAAEHQDRPPFNLTERWQSRRNRLDPQTNLNFVTTADIVGGNSGSPVVNEAGELVGVVFDGNIQSLAWNFAYDDRQARSIGVNSGVILQALAQIYDAERLVGELTAGR